MLGNISAVDSHKPLMKRRTNPLKSPQKPVHAEALSILIQQEVAKTVPLVVQQFSIERTEIFSGPIPSPVSCKGYEEILPGFTSRALAIAEKAQDADIAAGKRSDNYLILWKVASLFVALVISMLIVGGSIFLIYLGKDVQGFGVLVGGVATILGIILTNKVANK